MTHPIHHIVSFEQSGPWALRIQFEDRTSRNIDFSGILTGELFGPLRDPAVFAQVQLDPEIRTLVWPTGADFDPTTLHDWPEHEAAFHEAARVWSETPPAAL